jgi:SAM-dependent methyltransferase
MSNDFYRAFEERYRGSRELIKLRQRVYLPFIEPLLSFYKNEKAIDLGCGRGEWLELLKESGFDAQGVDLDEGMLEACHDLGLNVVTKDAISALKELPDESQIVVSGFHIAEHIDFSDLQLLVKDALRVLKPGGLLILETPNPENITVGTVNFYLDPTHQKPIPPLLLSFLPEYYGFFRVKLMRLQEDNALSVSEEISLYDVLGGVSPDYAVVAQKSADQFLIACNIDAFEKEYGLTLSNLAEKFNQQLIQVAKTAISAETQVHQASERAALTEVQAQQASERAALTEVQAQQASERATSAEAHAQQASERAALTEAYARQASERAALTEAQAHQASERAALTEAQAHQASERAALTKAQAQQANERATSAEAQAEQASERATSAEAQAKHASERAISAEAQAKQACERSANAESALLAIQNSTSWKLTAPLRTIGVGVKQIFQQPKKENSDIKRTIKLLLAHATLYTNRRPKLRNAVLVVLSQFPTLKARIKMETVNSFPQETTPTILTDLADLTPRAQEIYAALKNSIDRQQKRNI